MKLLKIMALVGLLTLVACEDSTGTTGGTQSSTSSSGASLGNFTGRLYRISEGESTSYSEFERGWIQTEFWSPDNPSGVDSTLNNYFYTVVEDGFLVEEVKTTYYSDGRIE